MKAVVRRSYAAGDVALMDIPEPSPKEGQVKIRVEYGGICGSDAKNFTAELQPGAKCIPPRVLGHEGVGIITELGPGVTNVQVGDRVAAETTVRACGICKFCRSGRINMCLDRAGLGSRADGYFAEYTVADAKKCHKIPAGVDPKGAAVLEPLVCGVNAVMQQSQVSGGDVVVVFGPGTIGQTAAQAAKANGAYVVLVGTPHSRPRLEVARQLGIDRALVTGEQDVVKEVMALTHGYGADMALEAAGSASAFDQALHCVRKLGQFVIMASPAGQVPFDVRYLFSRQITMVGAVSTDPSSWDKAMNLLERGLVNLAPLVSDVFPLDEWKVALEKAARHEGGKILLQP